MTVFTRRIVGIETEYGISCMAQSKARLQADEIARFMFRPIVDRWSSSNIYLPNASRLYLDVGSHPEIATAECDSLGQLIAYDRAGDEVVNQLAIDAEAQLSAEHIGGQVYLFKNNLDSVGNSYGCHENYLVSREVILKNLGKRLMPFLATRQLICGAGSIKDGAFQISQRADHVWETVSSATTRSRPIINTRDEPHADSHRFRRMHVIVGDSNMAEPSLALKVGSMLLVLEMLEAGFELPDYELANDIDAIRAISRDSSFGKRPVELQEGERSALEIQRDYFEAASRWLEQRPEHAQEEMTRVVALWGRVLDALERGAVEELAHDVDWAIKLNLARTFQRHLGLGPEDFSHPKLMQVDLAYHDIRPGRGLHRVLEAKGAVNRWVSPEEVAEAMSTAPSTTRAHLRGQFLAAAEETGAPFSVDWLRLKVSRPEPQVVELPDPFVTESADVDKLIAYMREHAESYRGAQ